ncbi:hypothetical protein KKH19_03015 [Patescibacteria group bacterium]|nr:hypothetical protein [Patescibacteria group bacterium]MBU2456975.1 hypothetical protein [Patescibacteria group bacterium]
MSMLNKFFGSNTRVQILKLFLLHPDQKYYLRQLARDLKLQINSVNRELKNLEKFGLLMRSSNNNDQNGNSKQKNIKRKYYKVNQEFVLFEEIKILIIKAQILYEKNFIDKLKKTGKFKFLALTGFFVNNQDSLTDLLIVGKMNKKKLLKVIKNLEKELNKNINFTLMDVNEFKYRKDITDVFLYNILEGKKIVILDLLHN